MVQHFYKYETREDGNCATLANVLCLANEALACKWESGKFIRIIKKHFLPFNHCGKLFLHSHFKFTFIFKSSYAFVIVHSVIMPRLSRVTRQKIVILKKRQNFFFFLFFSSSKRRYFWRMPKYVGGQWRRRS